MAALTAQVMEALVRVSNIDIHDFFVGTLILQREKAGERGRGGGGQKGRKAGKQRK